MRKTLLTAAVAITSIFTAQAQTSDLVFDNTFNNGNPYQDNFTLNLGVDYDYSDYGRMKQLNDSVFVYYINNVHWGNNEYYSEARAVISHSDGTAEHLPVATFSGAFANGFPDAWFITDIITNQSNGQVFVVRNGLYDDSGTERRCVTISGMQYSSSPAFQAISSWGENGSGVAVVSTPGTDMYNAKGSLMGSNPCVAYSYGNYPSPINVAFSTLGNMGAYSGFSVVTSNASTLYSQVADVVVISTTEVYIADNAYTYTYVNPNSIYNDNSRILKWKPANTILDITYGGGDGIADFSLGISTQLNTPFIQDQIKRILYDNGKILIAGTFIYNHNAAVNPVYGAVVRLSADGSLDNTFATNGKFSPDFSSDRFKWRFFDIDKSADGSIYVSGSGSASTSVQSPSECFILAVNDAGVIQTGKGNNGFLFDNENYQEIVEIIIVPGNSTIDDKFVFNGMKITNPNVYEIETAVGRLVWGTNTTGLFGKSNISVNFEYYPNPAKDIVKIKLNTEAGIQIYSATGILMGSYQSASNHSIDIRNFPTGLYFIQSEKGVSASFIKE